MIIDQETLEQLKEPEGACEILTDKMEAIGIYDGFIKWLCGSGLTTKGPVTPRFASVVVALIPLYLRDLFGREGWEWPETYLKPYPTASDGYVAYWKIRFALSDELVWLQGFRFSTKEHAQHAELYYLLEKVAENLSTQE